MLSVRVPKPIGQLLIACFVLYPMVARGESPLPAATKLGESADKINAAAGLQCGYCDSFDPQAPKDGLGVSISNVEATRSSKTWRLLQSHPVISIDFPGGNVDKTIAENLSKITGLQRLGLNCVDTITPAAAKIIGQINTLRVLQLGRFECDLAQFHGLTQLLDIWVEGQKLKKEDVRWLSLQPLQAVLLWDCEWPPGELYRLARCHNLRNLVIASCRFSDKDSKLLTGTRSLVSLSLNDCQLGGNVADNIARLPQLKTLGLGETNVSDDDLQKVAACQSLTAIKLEGTGVTDNAIEYLSACKNLQGLNVAHTLVTGRGFRKWVSGQAQNPRRPRLHINATGSRFDDEGMAELAKLKMLEKIQVSHTRVTGKGLAKLLDLPLLNYLELKGNSASDELSKKLDEHTLQNWLRDD